MDDMKTYSDDYSQVYNDVRQGYNYFSYNVFKNFIKYCNKGNLSFKNHIDLACGTGVFCIEMKKAGFNTKGIDISNGMISRARENAYKQNMDIPFEVGNMLNYYDGNKYDLVTCNYDAINHLLQLHEWMTMFKNVYNMLVHNKYFLFDFNTFKNYHKLCNMQPIKETIENCTYHRIVKALNEYQIAFEFKYTINNSNGSTKVFHEIVEESFYDNEVVFNAIKKSGFNIVCIYGKRFVECNDINDEQKLHVLCKKI